MELPLDPTVPLGGIVLILLLVWMTGGRRQASIMTPAEAIALLAVPETGFTVADIAVSRDGAAAIACNTEGQVAVVFPAGAHLAARRLSTDDITAVTVTPADEGVATLDIRSTAFTHPSFVLRLSDTEAARWHGIVQGHKA